MPVDTLEELQALTKTGKRLKYLHFWGHRTPGPGYLSQWWPAPFQVDGHTYATAEHYMMWRKAVLFDDHDTAAKILVSRSPAQAKAHGREVRGFDDAIWNALRYDIVVTGNTAKFGQHEELKAYLLGTGERVLVEASPVDRIWGIGLAADDPRAADPAQWRGLNLLGFALMRARAALREKP